MLRDMLPAIFQLATGLGFLIFLGTAILASAAKTTTWGRLLLVALLLVPLGFLHATSTGARSDPASERTVDPAT